CVSRMIRTGTPACHLLINALEYRQSVMNQNDTSIPTVSLLISCRIDERQSWYELSHRHSPPSAHAGAAATAFCSACGDVPELRARTAPTKTVTIGRLSVPGLVIIPVLYQR